MTHEPSDETGPGDPTLDPALAAALIASETGRVRSALEVRLPLQYLAWGIAWTLGFGAIWWQVHGQHPYQGPSGWPPILFIALLVLAGLVTAVQTHRATRGVHGASRELGMVWGLSWGLGFTAMSLLFPALTAQGAAPETLGVIGVALPALICGMQYIVGSGFWPNPSMRVIGCWLVAVAVVAAFAGPVLGALVVAVTGGGALLAGAAWGQFRRAG